jgi:hypothetical protein
MLLKLLIVSPEKFERQHYENDYVKTKARIKMRIPLKKINIVAYSYNGWVNLKRCRTSYSDGFAKAEAPSYF